MGGVCSFFFGCCGSQTHDPKGTTLVKDRSCTDKLVLLLWIAAWVVSIVVVSTAASLGGTPQKLLNAVDYHGDVCGFNAVVKDRPYGALLNPFTMDTDAMRAWTCVSDCAETKNTQHPEFSAMYGSTEFFGYCIPTFDFDASGGSVTVDFRVKSQFDAQFESFANEVSRAVGDVAASWEVILMSAAFALCFAYVYLWLTKYLAAMLIWLCILLVVAGGIFVGVSFLSAAADAPPNTSSNRVLAYQVAGYLFLCATGVFALVVLGLSSQIKLAIEVVKEGSKAINDMKLLVFFPLLPLLVAAGYLVYWVYGCLFIFSVSDLEQRPMPDVLQTRESDMHTFTYYGAPELEGTPVAALQAHNLSTYALNEQFRPLAAWHVFHLLWSMQFFVYWTYFVMAGAVCGWYWCLYDAHGNKQLHTGEGGRMPLIVSSMWRAVRYHLGTIAFAALIIAMVQFIRAVVKYVELKTRTNPPNYLQRIVFCLLQCCLKCVECCLDKISKNALIWCAMWGDPFLSSCCSSFALIWRNLARVAAVHLVGNVVLLVGKFSIAAMTVGLSALILTKADPWRSSVSSAFVPCILIALLSFVVAWLFFLTFETVNDAIFLCFLVDAENHAKSGAPMFASKGLQQLVTKYELRSATMAEQQKKDAAELYQAVGGAKVDAAPADTSAAGKGAQQPDSSPRAAWGNSKK